MSDWGTFNYFDTSTYQALIKYALRQTGSMQRPSGNIASTLGKTDMKLQKEPSKRTVISEGPFFRFPLRFRQWYSATESRAKGKEGWQRRATTRMHMGALKFSPVLPRFEWILG